MESVKIDFQTPHFKHLKGIELRVPVYEPHLGPFKILYDHSSLMIYTTGRHFSEVGLWFSEFIS